jgi:peptidoglycan hydrolase-like protein with peptidoglycan-binding domain
MAGVIGVTQSLAGRFQLVRLLGRGGMGEVWLADDLVLRRQVALKRVHGAAGPEEVERVLREGRFAASLRHPHVVSLHDLLVIDGLPCLVMEYVPGPSLAELLRVGPLEPQHAADLLSGIGWALARAHDQGLVHRDVKPANILTDAHRVAKLADFGIGRAMDDQDAALTRPGHLLGTVDYLAPEVALGHPASPASDAYSFGATLYAAVEGRSPLGHAAPQEPVTARLLRLVDSAPPAPAHAGPLLEVIAGLLMREPQARWPLGQAAAALTAFAEQAGSAPTQHATAAVGPTNTATNEITIARWLAPTAHSVAGPTPPHPDPEVPRAPGPVGSPRRWVFAVAGVLTLVLTGLALGWRMVSSAQPTALAGQSAPAGATTADASTNPTAGAAAPGGSPSPPPAAVPTPPIPAVTAVPPTSASPVPSAATRPRVAGAACPSVAQSSFPVIREGDAGPAVLLAQCQLRALGANLDVDGQLGPQTAAAVRAFQAARGLDVDGVVGSHTWTALVSMGARPLLRQGALGLDVTRLQAALRASGEMLVVDGEFGPETAAAVRRYQIRVGLSADAIVGPDTWTALQGGR